MPKSEYKKLMSKRRDAKLFLVVKRAVVTASKAEKVPKERGLILRKLNRVYIYSIWLSLLSIVNKLNGKIK